MNSVINSIETQFHKGKHIRINKHEFAVMFTFNSTKEQLDKNLRNVANHNNLIIKEKRFYDTYRDVVKVVFSTRHNL